MNSELDSVCPIFLRQETKFEQIGSGVLLEIKNQIFLLTAAHVSDWSKEGRLCIPTINGVEDIVGYFASLLAPKGLSRNDDKIDMAYYRLDNILAQNLHKDFKPLHRKECWLTDNLLPGDVYTFSGFPLNKSKNKNNILSFEMFSYSGEAAIAEKYRNLKCKDDTNIVINFRRKKALDPSGNKKMPPHPKGISGGGIFRWPKYLSEDTSQLNRSLVGIGHRYSQKNNCLIGTKLSLYYDFIKKNNPELFDKEETENTNSIPMFISLVCYKKEEWSLLMSQFDDAENMQDSWSQWRSAAENGIEHMDRNGSLMVPIELSAKEINEYCKSNNLPNVGQTRIELSGKKLIARLKESKII